jgi:hypothetical protein
VEDIMAMLGGRSDKIQSESKYLASIYSLAAVGRLMTGSYVIAGLISGLLCRKIQYSILCGTM